MVGDLIDFGKMAFRISFRRNDRYPDQLMTGRTWPGV